jgi:hypothetical protein
MSSNKKDDKNEPKSFDDVLNSILEEMDNVLNIKSDDIPNIDLYMDQVLSFLDDTLNYTRRSTQDGEEKIFTKTMINNYAKNDLLPSPVKKKYSKEHMMTLIFIYYLKSFLSINDVYTLINPITEDYFNGKGSINFEDVYDYILDVGEQRIGLLRKDIQEKYKASLESFSDVEGEEGEYLRLFLLISLLSYDIFIKKMLVEQLIDEIRITQKEKVEENSKSDKKKGK